MTMVCRGTDLIAEEKSKLEKIPNLVLRYNERVHAKCFYDEESMVITSLNLYKSSLGDNMEMGVILRNDIESDKIAYQQAKSEAQFIIRESELSINNSNTLYHNKQQERNDFNDARSKIATKPEKSTDSSIVKDISKFFGFGVAETEGHCIRCGETIPFNVDAPYCLKHYKTWARYKDPAYIEHFCHKCGHEVVTSKQSPLCSHCKK